jgi:hypothetical protein
VKARLLAHRNTDLKRIQNTPPQLTQLPRLGITRRRRFATAALAITPSHTRSFDVLPPPFVENISRGQTRTKKLPVHLRLMPPTAKTFNLRRHYANNNSANLLVDKFPKGFSNLRNIARNTQRSKCFHSFYHYGLLELAIVLIGTTGDQLLLFQQFWGRRRSIYRKIYYLNSDTRQVVTMTLKRCM